jgi:ABC-type branched-subunit amino acid transport system substrate-binding protein
MVFCRLHFALAGAVIASGLLVGVHGAHAQELLVGQVASQTSPVTAANAKGMATGMQAYFASVNDKGGVAGRPVKLITKDDNLVPAKMVDITKEFVADKNVLALAGYINTGGLTALVKDNLVGDSGIAMISPLQGDKAIVGAPNFFPFRSGYSDEVTALVKEAKSTHKQKVAIVYWNVTFGPEMVKLAQDLSKEIGLNVSTAVEIDAKDQAKFDSEVKQAANAVIKQAPDAIIMLISGRYAQEFIKQIRNSPAQSAQLYAMSIVPAGDVVKTVGVEKARGVVIAQAVPYPFAPGRPLVSEYQKIMKQYAPNEPFSFSTLEGFVTAKITVEALKRAGPAPTREKVLRALSSMGELNLGDVYVNYSPAARRGWGRIDLTIINAEGRLVR